ncbi:cellulose biosynthesis cyclic di-GMP-binding regulatory protein BcsB [Pantoea agglomerans]|uniref:cellulose biosynthesis cyclic di-GMP-binding regulatory protein BcsB n=1 Tax=Enterobacter agglomerans TaxID=549 RepID=UPI0013BA75CC|nr:cellulose biosynthesis cyclic di-GMP-binding regulatory protein BcsB [Pantoea agglomerans]NEG59438.1 cellulose biosynthesis cyclic di-GMP-binding regulatory protein BcsB [Pantoea agglomerans]NEH00666.1 cellulose biosynthesis cyclic di-GMP-binding regulatory protein BcsB [Pantoea agglomerans]NEH04733.1 cellulose biosynthesis cyclic di-GMP-binding regulatory protein BcsB [Pantoea agglomerans]NEH15962.1 cellulose biosynthesis cyclic di-GMP-binding regulatory protein BcsB [Pantoea agglomerans]
MTIPRVNRWFAALLLGSATLSCAAAQEDAPANINGATPVQSLPQDNGAPLRNSQLSFAQLAPPPGSMTLRGTRTTGQIEFGVRSDEVVTRALLNLSFRPSPALLPTLSQLKVYLNDELVGLITLTPEQLGKEIQTQMSIDPRYIADFNRVRFELVGHYANVCENPANSAIWLDIGKQSGIDLTLQKLPLKNDLSHFPEPFFDSRDSRPLTLPMVFSAQPDVTQQRAAAILASWFGSKTGWRGQRFPVLYNQLPQQQHAVVFATNDARPDFLKDLPPVTKPTVEIVSQPDNPYEKMLLILGRNDEDLLTAVQGIAQGELLLRGDTSTIDSVKLLSPRQAYDAPNWVRTDRRTTFAELTQYENQLQSDGVQPNPVSLTLNLPPDLFLVRARGIDMDLSYRYTAPFQSDGSRLAVNLNNQFIQDYPLPPKNTTGQQLLHIPLIQGMLDKSHELLIPALRLGVVNQLRFDFDYASITISGNADGRCETVTPITHHVVVDDNSSIDFSGYRHYIEMPSLRAWANAGFPFSRYADLAQTLVLMPPKPDAEQVSTLLNTLGNMGAQTGYPALRVQLTDDWATAKQQDVDLLMIGVIPKDLQDDQRIPALVDATASWLKEPVRRITPEVNPQSQREQAAESTTTISSRGPLATVIGFQSPFYDQRSVVALLADGTPRSWQLLNEAMGDSGKRGTMSGSTVVIRESGVNSLRVGESYYVGHLPWWERLWSLLSVHPFWLALCALFVVVLFALMTWRLMRIITRRRLLDEDE